MVNPAGRLAVQAMESSAYDGRISGDMSPMTCDDIVDDENGEHLSSSQVEIMIEKGLQLHTVRMYMITYTCSEVDTAQFKKRFHTHLEEQASAGTPQILIGLETNETNPPELSNI